MIDFYYIVEYRWDDDHWMEMGNWVMDPRLLTDFLAHILGIMRCERDEIRVKRVEWCQAQWEFIGVGHYGVEE